MDTHEEKNKHIEAFESYLEKRMGNYTINKAINTVAKDYGHSPRAVWKWYKWFNWKEREKERSEEIKKIMERKHNQIIAKNKNNYLTVTHTLLEDYVNEGLPTKIETIKDLETIVKLSLLLQGEPTNITKEESLQVDYTDKIKKMFDTEDVINIINTESENLINGDDDRNSSNYKNFIEKVLFRDKVCQCCGLNKKLEVHHINSYKNYKDGRTDVNNGVTLCKFCHQKYHTIYGYNHNVNSITFGDFMKKYGVKQQF